MVFSAALQGIHIFHISAPVGCLRWFWGVQGTVTSYNFEDKSDTVHLNNEKNTACIRQEPGMCSIVW